MDKQINKIKRSLDKAEGQTKRLLRLDKKQDKKLDMCASKKKARKEK